VRLWPFFLLPSNQSQWPVDRPCWCAMVTTIYGCSHPIIHRIQSVVNIFDTMKPMQFLHFTYILTCQLYSECVRMDPSFVESSMLLKFSHDSDTRCPKVLDVPAHERYSSKLSWVACTTGTPQCPPILGDRNTPGSFWNDVSLPT
jgi:hypothetical protein